MNVFTFVIKNESIKYLTLDPNAFEWNVKFGDTIKIEFAEKLEEVFNDKTCPFLIEAEGEYLNVWLNIVPKSVSINGINV